RQDRVDGAVATGFADREIPRTQSERRHPSLLPRRRQCREGRACFRSERGGGAGRRQAARQGGGGADRLHPSRRLSGRAGRARRAERPRKTMKIKCVEPIAVSFPMKKPVFMAGVEIRRADNVLVRIEADDGVVGWGEAASPPTMTGETGESMMAAIGYLPPVLEGRPAEDIARAPAALAARTYAHTGPNAATEIALPGSVGRATNKPAYALLAGKQRSRMAVLGVISTGELNSDLRDAEKKKSDGYVAFKIKVGIDTPLVDGERSRRLCQLLGRDALISSDANQGCSTQDAVQYVHAVADAGLGFFEQPVPADDIAGMATVAAAAGNIAIGADEGIHSLDDIRRHHERSAARGASLKAIKLGGMRA